MFCQVKDHNGVSGNDATSFIYYEKLDAVLGTRAASSSTIVLDSGVPLPTQASLNSSEQENSEYI